MVQWNNQGLISPLRHFSSLFQSRGQQLLSHSTHPAQNHQERKHCCSKMLNHHPVIHFDWTGLGHMPNLYTSLEPEGWNALIVLMETTYRKWSQLSWKFTGTQTETVGCRQKWQMNAEEAPNSPPDQPSLGCILILYLRLLPLPCFTVPVLRDYGGQNKNIFTMRRSKMPQSVPIPN